MRCLVMFITAVCLICLLKLKWPKNKSVYNSRNLEGINAFKNYAWMKTNVYYQLEITCICVWRYFFLAIPCLR